MEDELKIVRVEYLSKHQSDHHSMLNLYSGDRTKINKPELFKNLGLKLWTDGQTEGQDQIKSRSATKKNVLNGDNFSRKTTSKY